MEKDVYEVEARVQAKHWWFAGRRRLFANELARGNVSGSCSILDVGVGSGSNLRMLADLGYTNIIGLEPNAAVVEICAKHGFSNVRQGDICGMPFPSDSFDAVLATDVLEHVTDDSAALREISRVLRPGGAALITVPAFESLWGLQDEVAMHYRRYRLHTLRGRVLNAGFQIVSSYYFNYLLFFPIWLARQLIRICRLRLQSENELNTPTINSLLSLIFRFDVATARHLHPPFGVSALILANKPKT